MEATNNPYILVLYYSKTGNTYRMAEKIAEGIADVDGINAKIRTVAPIRDGLADQNIVPDDGPLYCEVEELRECSGLALGSPSRFGSIAAPLKHFIDTTTSLWLSGDLIDKPAGVFSSSSSMHGGNEATQLNMLVPLMHHGMIPVGLPYSEKSLHSTERGGTPYGPSSVCMHGQHDLNKDEIALCRALGKRLATIALKLQSN